MPLHIYTDPEYGYNPCWYEGWSKWDWDELASYREENNDEDIQEPDIDEGV